LKLGPGSAETNELEAFLAFGLDQDSVDRSRDARIVELDR
jgi:hypothetical protein